MYFFPVVGKERLHAGKRECDIFFGLLASQRALYNPIKSKLGILQKMFLLLFPLQVFTLFVLLCRVTYEFFFCVFIARQHHRVCMQHEVKHKESLRIFHELLFLWRTIKSVVPVKLAKPDRRTGRLRRLAFLQLFWSLIMGLFICPYFRANYHQGVCVCVCLCFPLKWLL